MLGTESVTQLFSLEFGQFIKKESKDNKTFVLNIPSGYILPLVNLTALAILKRNCFCNLIPQEHTARNLLPATC